MDLLWKADAQSSQHRTAIRDRWDLSRLDAWFSEEKRKVVVGPHRVPVEIRQLQWRPRGLPGVTVKRLARVVLLRDHFTRLRFDDDASGLVQHVPIGLPERLDARPLTSEFRGDRARRVIEGDPFHAPEEAATDDARPHFRE